MKHTPGRWRLGINPDTIVTDIDQNTSSTEIHYYGGKVIAESISSDKDRNLISAAPEMLEVLEEVLKYHNDEIHDISVWSKVESAIKKAKGELINDN